MPDTPPPSSPLSPHSRPPSASQQSASPSGSVEPHLLRDARGVKRRLAEEASLVVGTLESAIAALWELDTAKAGEVLAGDARIDREEVAIEEACFRVMTLQGPVARDFRLLTFILKANADIERVGDHACSIAKVTFKLADNPPPTWPAALKELGQRVPMVCHDLLRAMHGEDAATAKAIVVGDKVLDRLNRRLFDEVLEFMAAHPHSHAAGLLLYRTGRELERVGDLMTNIAEDIVYLATGEIVRHEKRRLREEVEGPRPD